MGGSRSFSISMFHLALHHVGCRQSVVAASPGRLRGHGSRLNKDVVAVGPRCSTPATLCRRTPRPPTAPCSTLAAQSVPPDARRSHLATYCQPVTETTSVVAPTAPRSCVVDLNRPGRADRPSCALRRLPDWWTEQRSVAPAHAMRGRLRAESTPEGQCPALRNGTECRPNASGVACPFVRKHRPASPLVLVETVSADLQCQSKSIADACLGLVSVPPT